MGPEPYPCSNLRYSMNKVGAMETFVEEHGKNEREEPNTEKADSILSQCADELQESVSRFYDSPCKGYHEYDDCCVLARSKAPGLFRLFEADNDHNTENGESILLSLEKNSSDFRIEEKIQDINQSSSREEKSKRKDRKSISVSKNNHHHLRSTSAHCSFQQQQQKQHRRREQLIANFSIRSHPHNKKSRNLVE